MQIHVRAPASLATAQMRAYAEYRVFAALARFGADVHSATVTLDSLAQPNRVTCLVDVNFGGERGLRCQSTEAHAADAIDRAADRLRRALQRRSRSGLRRRHDEHWGVGKA